MKTAKQFTALVLTGLSVWMMSCQDQYSICNQNKDVVMKASFYRISGGTPAPTPVTELTLSSLQGITIFNRQPNTPAFVVTLNPIADSTTYILKLGDGFPNDTLTIRYTNSSIVLSPECGTIFNHSITSTSTTNQVIDSVQIVDRSVTNVLRENLRIFY